MQVNNTGHQKFFKAGDIIMRQGDTSSSAYIIEDGEVEIIVDKSGKLMRMGTRGAGGIVGEMALVDQGPRTATVKATKDCILMEITVEDFTRRIKRADPVMSMIMQVILTRYRDTLTRAEILSDGITVPPPEILERSYIEKTNAVETLKIENDFKEAMENGDLSLNYQPLIDLSSKRIIGFEALMRWHHAEKGFIPPCDFIPVAEESGLIVDASKWGLREACNALKRIESHVGHDDNLYMSVNFSSRDFAEENFLEDLYNILSETDVLPSQIQLEITETLLMTQPDNAKEVLDMCRKAGMKIAIDDFGTGYSSLSYLHYFPIDTIKIDQCFIMGMNERKDNIELVKSMISLGKNLNIKVVAEGVEGKEEMDILTDLGCDVVQGYYFARPMPENDVNGLVLDWGETSMKL